jgi:hypothetical protein
MLDGITQDGGSELAQRLPLSAWATGGGKRRFDVMTLPEHHLGGQEFAPVLSLCPWEFDGTSPVRFRASKVSDSCVVVRARTLARDGVGCGGEGRGKTTCCRLRPPQELIQGSRQQELLWLLPFLEDGAYQVLGATELPCGREELGTSELRVDVSLVLYSGQYGQGGAALPETHEQGCERPLLLRRQRAAGLGGHNTAEYLLSTRRVVQPQFQPCDFEVKGHRMRQRSSRDDQVPQRLAWVTSRIERFREQQPRTNMIGCHIHDPAQVYLG